MADKKKTNKKKLSTLIKQQVPEFVLSDHPKFTEFLTSYFLFMESAELNLDTFTAIDNILLETVGVSDSFVLLNQTNKNGLDYLLLRWEISIYFYASSKRKDPI